MYKYVRTPRAKVIGVKKYRSPEVYKVSVEVKRNSDYYYSWEDLDDRAYNNADDARRVAIDWVNGDTKVKTRDVGEVIGYQYNDERNPLRWEGG